MDTEKDDRIRLCYHCGRVWCGVGCRGYRKWFGVAVGLGFLLAVGLCGLAADGCLSADRAEILQKSLSGVAEEVKEGSKEVINAFADRLEGVVEKIPTKFEIAPTEVKVTITSFKDSRLVLVGFVAFCVGIPFGVAFVMGYQRVRAVR